MNVIHTYRLNVGCYVLTRRTHVQVWVGVRVEMTLVLPFPLTLISDAVAIESARFNSALIESTVVCEL